MSALHLDAGVGGSQSLNLGMAAIGDGSKISRNLFVPAISNVG